jgi:signal peptidase II
MSHETHDGMPLRPKIVLVVALVAAIIAVDLVTKAVAERMLADRPTIHLLGDTVRIGYVLNAGVFLSLGHALSPRLRFWLFVVGVSGVLAMLLGLTFRDPRFRKAEVVAVASIVGGGVGNLCDRVQLGVVRDFMNVGVGSLRTGIFNVADMAITFGGIALIVLPILRRKGHSGT